MAKMKLKENEGHLKTFNQHRKRLKCTLKNIEKQQISRFFFPRLRRFVF